MRRSPLPPRRKPIARTRLAGGVPIARTTLTRSGPLRPRSARMQRIYRTQRIPLVKATLAGEPLCQLILPGCTGLADTVHEVKPRGRGGSITDPANCLPACRSCNDGASNEHIGEAQARGLLKHSWDLGP
jgi:5-methylcytosine-specific restriction endonuclease McrA